MHREHSARTVMAIFCVDESVFFGVQLATVADVYPVRGMAQGTPSTAKSAAFAPGLLKSGGRVAVLFTIS